MKNANKDKLTEEEKIGKQNAISIRSILLLLQVYYSVLLILIVFLFLSPLALLNYEPTEVILPSWRKEEEKPMLGKYDNIIICLS